MIREALGSVIRLALLTAVTTTGGAILLARANPTQSESTTRRVESAAPYRVLDASLNITVEGGPRLLDVETGRLGVLHLPPRSALDLASVSPWEDQGGRQVVGLGWDRSIVGPSRIPSNLELVRMSLPGGATLDRVDLTDHVLPAGPPCWFPGALARVLYAGQDGRIYRVDFESTDAKGSSSDSSAIRPRALTWRAPAPAGGEAVVVDLAWPDDARLGGRLLATLRINGGRSEGRPDWQIWWLELDRAGTSIIAAGRLLQPATDDTVGARRLPTLVSDIGGGSALAYLAKVPQEPGYQLRIAPVRFDAGTKAPQAREARARVLARGCSPATPAVSADGRWVTVIRPDGQSVKAERLALGGAATLIARLP